MFLTTTTAEKSSHKAPSHSSSTSILQSIGNPQRINQLLYAFYVLKRQYVIFACKWTVPVLDNKTPSKQKKVSPDKEQEEQKLLSGLLFTIKTFCQKLTPSSKAGLSTPSAAIDKSWVFNFS